MLDSSTMLRYAGTLHRFACSKQAQASEVLTDGHQHRHANTAHWPQPTASHDAESAQQAGHKLASGQQAARYLTRSELPAKGVVATSAKGCQSEPEER